MKAKKSKAQSKVKSVIQPESFNWNGLTYYAGDKLTISVPQVGLYQEQVKINNFYRTGSWTVLNLQWLDWCTLAVTLQTFPAITGKWWLHEWHELEDGRMGLGRIRDNPYRQMGCPNDIWNIPMQLEGKMLQPVDGWEQEILVRNVTITKAPLVQEITSVGAQLFLF